MLKDRASGIMLNTKGWHMKLKASILMVLFALPCSAVMIRDDVPENRYIDLARTTDFQAGRVLMVDARGDYSGVLVGPRHVLTVGHPIYGYLDEGASEGPLAIDIRIDGLTFQGEYAFLHPDYDTTTHFGGADLAIVRLAQPVAGVQPATIWTGGIRRGERFVGVGQGKSGTGSDTSEHLPTGVFRGYENTADYMDETDGLGHFRADFDNGSEAANTLAKIVYGDPDREIAGFSAKEPLPLEGSVAAGDSGSGIWLRKEGGVHLAGIASYRYYSMYGGQSGYVNLGNARILNWIESVDSSELAGLTTTSCDNTWKVTEIYIATLGYAPDNEGLQYWISNLSNGGWIPSTVAQSFFDQPLVQAQYPEDQGYGPFIEALYQNLFGRAPDTDGYRYWLAELESGRVLRNQMIITLIEAGWSNSDAAQDMARFGNRVQVGLAFAAEQAARGILYSTLTSEEQAQLRELGAQVLAGVTADVTTRDTAIQGIPARLDTL
jgi:hypothetical protein